MNSKGSLSKIAIACILAFTKFAICLSFGQAIYSGLLLPYLNFGVILILLGAGVNILIIVFLSKIPMAVARPQDEPLPLMVIMVQSLILPFTTAGAAFPTVLATIILTTFMTGLILYLFGLLKWGNFSRYIPFPILAGFLAATGMLLIMSAVHQLLPADKSGLSLFAQLLETKNLLLWLPSVGYGILLFICSERFQNSLVFSGILLSGIVVFYLIVIVSGISITTLKSWGLLLEISPISFSHIFSVFHTGNPIHWSFILKQFPFIFAIAMVSTFALLFIILSLELVLKREIDFNKELKIAGLANLFGGLTGGIIGYHGLSNAVILSGFNMQGKAIGIICGISVIFSIFFIDKILGFFPHFLLIGLVVYLGISLLYRWTIGVLSQLDKMDKTCIAIVLLVTLFFGFIEGILSGLLISILFFIITYSRTPVIRYSMNGSMLSSTFERETVARMVLKQNGNHLVYVKLQDYLFFGSTNHLTNQLHEMDTEDAFISHFVLYDFAHVTGLDSSVMMNFQKMSDYAAERKIFIVLTGFDANPAVKNKMYAIQTSNHLIQIEKTDDALIYCENQILEDSGYFSELNACSISLEDFLGDKTLSPLLSRYFIDLNLAPNTYLVRQGDRSHDLFYLESGQILIFIGEDGNRRHLATIGPGNIIGEIAFYLHSERSASMVTLTTCKLKALSHKNLKKLQKEHADFADIFNQTIIHILSKKLINTTKKVDLLSR